MTDETEPAESPAELRRKLAEAKTDAEERALVVKIVAAGPLARVEDEDELDGI